MSTWLACLCLVAAFIAAVYLLIVILRPERY